MRRSGSGMPTRLSQSMARRRAVAAQRGVRGQRLDDLVAHAHDRVQAGRGLLEDHADAPAPHAAHRAFRQAVQVLAVQVDLSAHDAAGIGQQPQQRQRGHALAAAGLADQREGFAPRHRQSQALDGLGDAAFAGDVDFQITDFEHG